MRYFLIAYAYQNGVGNLYFSWNWSTFPSCQWIKEAVLKHNEDNVDMNHISPEDLAITNIYEFDSKEDYDNFCGH